MRGISRATGAPRSRLLEKSSHQQFSVIRNNRVHSPVRELTHLIGVIDSPRHDLPAGFVDRFDQPAVYQREVWNHPLDRHSGWLDLIRLIEKKSKWNALVEPTDGGQHLRQK